jgi:hypothetical protein
MNGVNRFLTLLVAGACAMGVLAETTFVETFEDGGNEGGWWYGTANGYIDPIGGNPGAYFRDPYLDTFAPQPRTSVIGESEFTGDYRAKGVMAVGIDLKLFYVDFSADGRPLSVILVSDNGTPGDYNDDWGAYHVGDQNVPLMGEGWLSYDFEVPSQAPELPPGWAYILFGPDSPAEPDWNDVITDVTQLRFFYGHPEYFFIFQVWDVGMDNPRITYEPPSPPGDLNGDGCVDQGDLGILLADWNCAGGDCPGDVDGDGDTDQGDLGILLAHWGEGCA